MSDATSSPDLAEQRRALFSPGNLVDHFRVMRLLGRGGMGEVYLARDTKLGRKVALKVIHPEQIGSEEATERFLHEARAMARFSHPHIVTVYAVGELGGSPYVALEYLEGQTLRERMREERPSTWEAMRLGLAIAQALEEAHRNRVLHRDLKPENALIPRDGRLRVVDFGLAKIVAGREASYPEIDTARPAVEAEMRGTPAYMAPEQWMEREPTEATDIWALGVILYELISGGGPYHDSTIMELALKVCSPDPVPPLETSLLVPTELRELALRCLEKKPEDRPTGHEVVHTLEALLVHHRRGPGSEGETCPFRGLLPFSERHAEFFFGRDAEISAFLERMREQPVLPVVGPSGAGKSSFVQAGVVPRLREQGQWVVLQLRPGSRPFLALAARLLHGESATRAHTVSDLPTVDVRRRLVEEEATAGPPERETRLAEQLAQNPALLNLMLHQSASRGRCRVLLVVDQLEEIYTHVEEEEVRRRFMQAISSAADDAQDPVRVVFTLRDDFLVRLAAGAEAREALSHVTVLRSPDPANLEQTLVRPLEALGYAFDDPSLPGEMVGAVRDEPAALPLLQFVTRMLWDQRDTRRRKLLRAAYVAAGGVEGALARHADGVLETMTPEQVEVAREMLLRLVSAEGTRRVLAREDVLAGLTQAQDVLGRLTLARLITVRRAHGAADAELELVHESLVRTWARLARWVEESHEDLAFLGEVTQAAELWARRGHRDAEVWQGDALHEARRHLERLGAVPALVRRFFEAAQRKERRATRARRLRLAAGFAVLAIAAVAALLVALALSRKEQQSRRRLAEVQREGARAALQRGDLLEARAKLRSSLETQDSPLARALWWQLEQDPLVWSKTLGSFIYEVEVSPDGRTVAAACQDKSIYLIDLASTAVRILRGHEDQVFALAFAPDGRRLASGTWSGEIRIWDLRRGTHRLLRGHSAAIWSLAYSPDGTRLASASYDRTARIWDVTRDAPPRVLRGHADRLRWISFSPDGTRLVTASYDRTVRVWDVSAGAEQLVLKGHTDRVYGALFLPDGRRIVSSGDRTVRIWDLARPGQSEVAVRHGQPIYGIALSPDGRHLAFGSHDQRAYIWDLLARRVEQVLAGHTAQLYSINFSPDGKHLVTGSVDKTVRLWDPGAARRRVVEAGHTSSVYGVAFSPDGKQLASASYDRTLRLWDVRSGQERAVLAGHTGVVFTVRFNPDGKQLASASLDQTVRLWDVARGVEQRVLAGHEGGVTDLAYTPDGLRLASSGWDKTVRIWDSRSGAQQRVLRGHTDRVMALAMSPDGRSLASGSTDKTIRIWDLASGAERQRLLAGHDEGVYGLDFSPDGRHLASGSLDKTIRIWDLERGTFRRLDRLDSRIYWLHYHPDSRRICAPLSDGTARIYDVQSGAHTALRGHRSEVNFCTFSPDGALAATSSDDNTVRLWDTKNARPFWRAPVLLDAPPRLLTHGGWSRLDGTPGGDSGRPAAWRDALASGARRADGLAGPLCLQRHDGAVELWDRRADRRLRRTAPLAVRDLLSLPGGCVVLTAGGQVRLLRGDGERTLAHHASAVALDRGEVLVAAGGIQLFDAAGGRVAGRRANRGAVALTRTRRWLVLGFEDGNLELVPRDAAGPRPSFSFEQVPSSAVVRMLEGPMGTLIVGYASGLLGVWDLRNGSALYHVRLHGPVAHLMLRGTTLYAATELGQSHVLDLSIFHVGYCDLLRQVWGRVPIVWEAGLPVIRPPPRRHDCRR